MSTTRASARVFNGSEILPAIVAAVEALQARDGLEIAEFHAGENMQIVAVYGVEAEDGTLIGFNTDAWDGEKWSTIQWD